MIYRLFVTFFSLFSYTLLQRTKVLKHNVLRKGNQLSTLSEMSLFCIQIGKRLIYQYLSSDESHESLVKNTTEMMNLDPISTMFEQILSHSSSFVFRGSLLDLKRHSPQQEDDNHV